MTRSIAALLSIGFVIAIASAGCSSPSATPTVKPTETESIQFVVVTATAQPTLETTTVIEPTITPLATFTPIGLNSPTSTKPATASPTVRRVTSTPVASTPRPPSTAQPTAARPTATSAPAQNSYPAPQIIGPAGGTLINDGNSIQLQFLSVGPLPSDVCYLAFVQFVNPNANPGNVGVLWSFNCGDQSDVGTKLTLPVTKFRGDPYNYIELRDKAESFAIADYLNVTWTVTVGRKDGTPLGPISSGFPIKFQPR